MTSRTFPLGVVLTAIHDRHVSDFDEYREFLSFMTRTELNLWNIAGARRAVQQTLRHQYPKLFDHHPPEKTDSGNAGRYVKSVAKAIGTDALEVRPLKRGAYTAATLSEALR